MEKEDLNNSLLSLASVLLNEEHVFSPPYWFGGVAADDKIIGCGIHACPDGLVITEVPNVALPYLVKSLGPLGDQLRPVYSPVETTKKYADLWSKNINVAPRIQSRWHDYRASQLNSPRIDAQGHLRLGNCADSEVVTVW